MSQAALRICEKEKYSWKRLSEMYKTNELNIIKEPPEIKNDPDVLCEDPCQGELGDCYFLSAISALAENPKRIRQLIPNSKFSHSGVFEVIVYLHGEPTKIIIDDYFPVIEDLEGNPKIAFVGFNQKTNNIWPLILEKAWAKCNLNYENIIAGNSAEAFEFLFPAPIDTYYHEIHGDRLFDRIKDADDKSYIICTDVTANENTNVDYLIKMGLITNHAYTIIDAAEVHDSKGKLTRLLKIRNPWGTNEWTGDWSDKSPKWTPEMLKLLRNDEEDDGTFWMSYEDFCKFYTTTHVAKVHDDYHFISTRISFNKNNPFNIIHVNIPKNTKGFFVVNQKNGRIYKNVKGIEDFENKFCSVIVFKKENDDTYKCIGTTAGRQNRLYVECENITAGNYFIAISFPSKSESIADVDDLEIQRKENLKIEIISNITFRVAVYSPLEKLNLSEVKSLNKEFANFLKDVVIDLAKSNKTNIYYFQDEGEKESFRSISFERESGAYGYIYYDNNSEGFINEHLTFTNFLNINLIPMIGDENLERLDTQNEAYLEDQCERNAVELLKRSIKSESKVKVINVVPEGELISESNPIEILITVAPKSNCLILVEKYDEMSSIELTSNIAISYPMHFLLEEKKFQSRKNRLKYNNKYVEVYENIIEHNTGVIFKYRNKTKDLRVSIHLTFDNLENLVIGMHSDQLKKNDEKVEDPYASVDPSKVIIDIYDPDKEVIVDLDPDESKFFELSTINVFESFSYNCEMDYNINLSRNNVKHKYGMK